jgi:dolichol-phosphate mannosyltransferase
VGTLEPRGNVAVVVPTYNEAEILPILAEALFGLGVPGLWLVVVDDGSPDGTGDVARRLGVGYGGRVEVVQRPSKLGLGTAYVAGFATALQRGAGQVVQMDADLSHPPSAVPAMLEALARSDVVVGSRYVRGKGADERTTVGRKLMSSWANFAIRLVTGVRVKDTTSGFKAFRREALTSLDWTAFRCHGFAFQAEVAYACQRRGLSVMEHPIVFANRAGGESKMSLGIVVEAVWQLLFMRFKRR